MTRHPSDDDGFDLPPVPDGWMWRRIASYGLATGALAGGIEVLLLGARLDLEMRPMEMAALVLATIVIDALFGGLTGVVGGLAAQVLLRSRARWRRYRAGFTMASGLLALYFLLPVIREMWQRDQRTGAAGAVTLTLLLIALAFFNSGYWLRRTMIGGGPALGWRLLGPLGGLALGVLAAFVSGPSVPRAPLTTPDLPNLVLFTIDTLRRDHVGLYGTLVNTPRMDALGRAGVIYDDAITSLPETLPSHVSMLTGLQPGQTHVLSNGGVLRSSFQTVTEQLASSGYRTGAFVSSFAVDGQSGLTQGFQVYDDDFFPYLRGITQVRAARVALPLLMRFGDPAAFPFLLERGTPETLRRALAWVDEPSDRPFFLWVHIFDPHSPYEPRDGSPATVDHRAILAQEPGYVYTDEERRALKDYYRQEAEYSDSQVGVLFDALKERGQLDHAAFIVTADHGEALGEHDINFSHHGIYDDTVRVPLIVWTNPAITGTSEASTAAAAAGTGIRIDRMVNVADISNTLLDYAGLPLLGGTNAIPLLSLARGVDITPRGVVLLGREGASLTDGQLCGVRDPRGVKYIRHQDGREEVYDLDADPGELLDIAGQQPSVVDAGRTSVESCAGQVVSTAGVDEDTRRKLEAMGYLDGPP